MPSDATAIKPGMYFVKAFGGTANKTGRDFGLLVVVSVNAQGAADTAQMFCDRDVAERAGHNFRPFDPIQVETIHTVWNGELRPRVTEVLPA